MKIGVVKAVRIQISIPFTGEGTRQRKSEERLTNKSSNSPNAEQSPNSQMASKNQQQTQNANRAIEPHGINRRFRPWIHRPPPPTHRKAIIPSIRKRHPTRCNHAALAHEKAGDDGQREHGQYGLLRHALYEVGGERLAQRRLERGADVDDSVCDYELEEPAKGTPDGGCEHDGARRGDVRIRTLLGQMKGRIVAAHGPDDADEAHQDGDPLWEARTFVDGAPDLPTGAEPREAAVLAIGACGDEDDDGDEGEEVEGRACGVDLGEPACGERGHGRVDDHEEDGEEEGLVVCRGVAWVLDRDGGERHGGYAVVDCNHFFHSFVRYLYLFPPLAF